MIYAEYRLLSKKGEGTFSEVLKAQVREFATGFAAYAVRPVAISPFIQQVRNVFLRMRALQSIKNGQHVAIKCMKATFTSLDQVNNLREVQALRRLSPHPHIVKLIEVLL